MGNINLTEYLCKVASANLEKDFTGKYYLAMGFDDDDSLNRKHITVVYFAEQPKEAVEDIIRIIDDYVNKNGFKSFEIDFDKVEMFGPEKNIKVVRPGSPKDDSDLYLPRLKKALYKYNKSSFKDQPYKPHVTTDKDKEGGRVNRLVLASGDKIIKSWQPTNEKTARQQDVNDNAAPWDLNQGEPHRKPNSFKRSKDMNKLAAGFYKKAIKLDTAMKAMEGRYIKNLLKNPTEAHKKSLRMLGEKHKKKINDLIDFVSSETNNLKPRMGYLKDYHSPYDVERMLGSTSTGDMSPLEKFKNLNVTDRKLMLEKIKDFKERFKK